MSTTPKIEWDFTVTTDGSQRTWPIELRLAVANNTADMRKFVSLKDFEQKMNEIDAKLQEKPGGAIDQRRSHGGQTLQQPDVALQAMVKIAERQHQPTMDQVKVLVDDAEPVREEWVLVQLTPAWGLDSAASMVCVRRQERCSGALGVLIATSCDMDRRRDALMHPVC